jgi:hypothetical protein
MNRLHDYVSRWLSVVAVFALVCATSIASVAANTYTAGGVAINSQATSTYSDGTLAYATSSNNITITVSKIAGLIITPDAGSNPAVVLNQTGVSFVFTVTNDSNFSNNVLFKANGASIIATNATVTSAVITGPGTDIFSNGADVTSAAIGQNGAITVTVNATVTGASGTTVNIQLGDAGGGTPFDDQPAALSANEVRTTDVTAVNGNTGRMAARGDINALVNADALLELVMTAPAGPIALGSDITYGFVLTNNGLRAAGVDTVTFTHGGPFAGIFVVVPIPGRTLLKNNSGFPANTLYSTTVGGTNAAATWTSTLPALATITRVALYEGGTLAASASTTSINVVVTVQTGVDGTLPVGQLTDAYGVDSQSVSLVDESGDTANNHVPGVTQNTSLQGLGGVLLGPFGQQAAVGPTSNNDDFTNLSVNTGIAGVPPGGSTTTQGVLIFKNTIQNTGNGNDTYTFTAPTVPAGFTVELSSTSGVAGFATISGGGNTTLAVPFASTATIWVRITAPSGNVVLTAYPTTIHALSGVDSSSNNTIERLYTGYLSINKGSTVSNTLNVVPAIAAGSTPVPGATIAYVNTYLNVTTVQNTNDAILNAASIVVIDVIDPAKTDFKVGSITSNLAAGITSVTTAFSNDSGATWTYTPASLAGGAPAGFDRLVTNVRFSLTGTLGPLATGDAGFTVRIR